jgi:hypothetical protein
MGAMAVGRSVLAGLRGWGWPSVSGPTVQRRPAGLPKTAQFKRGGFISNPDPVTLTKAGGWFTWKVWDETREPAAGWAILRSERPDMDDAGLVVGYTSRFERAWQHHYQRGYYQVCGLDAEMELDYAMCSKPVCIAGYPKIITARNWSAGLGLGSLPVMGNGGALELVGEWMTEEGGEFVEVEVYGPLPYSNAARYLHYKATHVYHYLSWWDCYIELTSNQAQGREIRCRVWTPGGYSDWWGECITQI